MTDRSHRSRPMPSLQRWVGKAAMLALAVLALAPPAHAQVILHEKFADSFSNDSELCGIPVHTDFEFSGVTHLRVGTGDLDSAFFLLLRIQTTETITNPANGKFLVIEGNNLLHDTKATPTGGSVFQFTSVEAGQPFVLRDMTGAVVLRNRGVIRTTILFDTLGDDTPGGVTLEELDVSVAGPHPEFFMDEDDFCALVQDLIG
jgi:hypothetical protein